MLRSLLVIGILVFGIGAALRSRVAGLLLYLWFALFRPMDWMWWDISAFRPSLVLGLLLVVPCLLSGSLPTLSHPLNAGSVLFLLTALAAQTNAIDPATGWMWVDYLFRLILVCSLAVTLVADQRTFRVVVAVIAGSFGFHAAKAGLASILGGGVRFFEGPGGAFTDNNGYAVGMAMIIPLIVVSAQVAGNRWIKWGFYTAVPLAAVAVVGTFSRGGFLALVAAGLTLVLLKRRIAALCMVVLVAAPLWWFAGTQEGYVERLSTIQTYDEVGEASALSRLHFWAVAVRMAQANVLGVGLFNYERAYDQYDFLDGAYGRRRSVHSSPFQVLAETGFMGAAVFGFLFVYGFICTRRVRRRAKNKELSESDRALLVGASDALVASMVGFLVGGSFIAMALNDLTWFTFALIATLDRISATLTLPSPSAVVVPRASQRVAGWPGARPSVQWRQHERG